MRKVVVIMFLGVILLVVGWGLVKNRVGDVRPAVLPPLAPPSASNQKNLPQIDVDIPLTIPPGYKIEYFAKNIPGARDLELSPGGSLLVSQTSQGKVTALPGGKTVLSGLKRPHGLAFFGGKLFVAEETRVVRYTWDEGNLQAEQDKVLFDLPPAGNHFTRSLIFDPSTNSGQAGKLYVSIGSTCNVCVEKDSRYGAILVSDPDGNSPRVLAQGLRNSVFMTINPDSGEIWATDMGRDLLGDNIPPDEINIIKEGDYGWPYCYKDRVHDNNFDPGQKRSCDHTIVPIFEVPAHSAPLGLVFWDKDLLVAYHGSWNRSVPSGYKVVRLKVSGNRITGEEDFIAGFLPASANSGNQAYGRPVDVIVRSDALYVSDDKAGVVYQLSKISP